MKFLGYLLQGRIQTLQCRGGSTGADLEFMKEKGDGHAWPAGPKRQWGEMISEGYNPTPLCQLGVPGERCKLLERGPGQSPGRW